MTGKNISSIRGQINRAEISKNDLPSNKNLPLGLGISRSELLLAGFDSRWDPTKGNSPAECTILRHIVQSISPENVVRRTGWIDFGTNPKPMIHTSYS